MRRVPERRAYLFDEARHSIDPYPARTAVR